MEENEEKKKKQRVKMRDETYRHIAIRDGDVANRVQTDMTKIEQQQPKMRNIYRLNEVLHRLIKKKHKGNKNIQQIDRTFTFIILKLKFFLFFLERQEHFLVS